MYTTFTITFICQLYLYVVHMNVCTYICMYALVLMAEMCLCMFLCAYASDNCENATSEHSIMYVSAYNERTTIIFSHKIALTV